VAAPTAGLHFTESLLDEIRSCGVRVCFVTLHVGMGTFAPVKAEAIAAHIMHEERYELSEETARVVNEAKRGGRRVIAVGTTSLRVMETVAEACSKRREEASSPRSKGNQSLPGSAAARPEGPSVAAGAGKTRIFIYPPYGFKVADGLLTNFHLPRSTLLMLASAFAAPNETRGRELILSAYEEAIRERYRFFSYGDAMLIV
jgi:S-adenosylmethionine:tRNA ribosyltransferase-isomerase